MKKKKRPKSGASNSVETVGPQIDRGLLLVVLFLIGVGIVQVYSSSFIFAIEKFDDGLYFFRKQLIFAAVGIVMLVVAAKTPWRWLEKYGFLIFLVAVAGVAATFIPGVGVKVGGAHRWVALPGGFRLEPSEIVKLGFPFWAATLFARDWGPDLKVKWAAILAGFGIPLLLLLKQPDFGSFAICTLVLFGIMFAQGLSWGWVLSGAAAASTAFYFLIVNEPYRRARLLAFLNPWSDPDAKGFQIIQSLLSYYSGGLTGTGLGQGQGKLFFLPEAHTDFTAAVLGEEMGFLGIFTLLCLYGYVVLRGLQISVRAENPRQRIVALGLTLVFALSSFLNFGVSMGLLPTKGLALPFISYGGSSLIASALAIGFLLNIDKNLQLERVKSFKGIRIK